jgi:CheY-like chemotaxis protein
MAKDLQKESPKYTILVVDDEELIRKMVFTFLSKLGHSCLTAIDGVNALQEMKGNKIDAVVTDIKMPNMDGITLIGELSTKYPGLPIMVMTAFEEEYSAGIAISVGAREFIKKPFSLEEFAIRLHKMINDAEALRRLKSQKGADEEMEDLMKELEETLKKR